MIWPMAAVGTETDARRAALAGLVDHAPLFPPASMGLEDAVAEDARAAASKSSSLLGRFVVPALRLGELDGFDRALSVVLDGPLAEDARIEAVEARLPEQPQALAELAPEVYVELPLDDDVTARIGELAALGLRSKVRCGGAVAPSVADLARFVRACREAGVVFKATAGLHHAVRRGEEHGLLNLLAAAVFGDEEAALAESDPAAFRLDAEGFAWRDREAGASELARIRRELLHSVGSCSFFEPVCELEALGVLPL